MCVLATGKGAIDAGFQLTLLRGAHSTYDTKSKSAIEIEADVEKELQGRGAGIISWEDAVAAWEQRRMIATHSLFSD